MKRFNSNNAVGWAAWVTLSLMTVALGAVKQNALAGACSSPWGGPVIVASGLLGLFAAWRSRYFGMLIGATIPTVFAIALALRWSSSAVVGYQIAAVAIGLFAIIFCSRIAIHLVQVLIVPQGVWRRIWMICLPLFIIGMIALGARLTAGIRREELPGVMNYSVWITFAWGLFLTAWRPTLFLRAIILLLGKTLYRVRLEHGERFPDAGPVLLVANHVSFLDALMILGLKPRKITFMIHHTFYRQPGFYWFFRWVGALEVPGAGCPKKMQALFDKIHRILNSGGAVCVFPEGSISANGIMQEFKSGVASMLPDPSIPVIPVRLGMLWGSLLGEHGGRLRFIKPHKLPIPASIYIGEPIPPDWSGFQIWQKIGELGAEAEMAPVRGEKTIHHRFMKRAKQHPWQVTFSDGETGARIGNFMLLVRALILGDKLRRLSAERGDDGDYMGLLMPNRTVTAAALLGIMYADRGVAILNFTAGREALAGMSARAGLKTIVTSRAFIAKLKLEALPEMVFLEDIAAGVTGGDKLRAMLAAALIPHGWLIRRVSPRRGLDVLKPAVVLFSSGSTGRPKGVMLSHHNFNSNIMSFWRTINWQTNSEKLIGNLPFFHAFGLTVGFCFPATTGTKVALIANPLDGATICRVVREEKVTLMISTPTFLQSCMHCCKPGDFASLRLVVTGAEKLQRKLFDSFKAATGLAIVEGYGCTEMSPIVSINLSSSSFTLGKESGPFGSIGVAMPGIAPRIVHPETGEVLPENCEGLLQLKSASMMLGYLDDPVATAGVITPDGYYNTNDVATIDRNGYIRIVGRLSRFSKIGGEMVPHEMIERRIEELSRHDGGIAVTARPDARKGEQLVVFYVDADIQPETLITGLRESGLPNLWIPRVDCFYRVDAIPMLGNGKKDLKKLQELARESVAA